MYMLPSDHGGRVEYAGDGLYMGWSSNRTPPGRRWGKSWDASDDPKHLDIP